MRLGCPGAGARISAELLGQADEDSFGPTHVAEPVRVFVSHHIVADELRAVIAQAAEGLIDIVDCEHDAQVAGGVHRGVPMIGDDRRFEEAREFESAVAVRRAHHRDLDPLIPQADDPSGLLSLHQVLPFELESEFAEERDRRDRILDDDADIVYPHGHGDRLFRTCRPRTRLRVPPFSSPAIGSGTRSILYVAGRASSS